MAHKKLIILLAGLVFVSAGSFAQNIHGSVKTPSDVSVVAGMSVLLAGSVVVMPSALAAEGSGKASEGASNVSTELSGTTKWTVEAVRVIDRDATEVDLLRDDRAVRQTVRMDNQLVRKNSLAVGDDVTINQTGKRSFVLKRGEVVLSPMTYPQAGLNHSKARE